MTKKTRFIILLLCFVAFLLITPNILLYSLGYRADFENMKITPTGGIYVRVLPKEANVVIDNKSENSTGLFSNAVFVQDLLPKEHIVLIKKDGYYDYQKELPVTKNEVTKLENVILFKKEISFEVLSDRAQFEILIEKKSDGFKMENNNLYAESGEVAEVKALKEKPVPVIKNLVAYKTIGGNIMWVGLDGFLKNSETSGLNTEILSQIPLKIDKKNIYSIINFSEFIFLKENNNLLLFDGEKKYFKDFYGPVKEVEISPNANKMLMCSDDKVTLYDKEKDKIAALFYGNLAEKIRSCSFINNDYIVFIMGEKIMISETDSRGNVNTVSLPSAIKMTNGENIRIVAPEIFWSNQDKKLYILMGDSLLLSEKLIP